MNLPTIDLVRFHINKAVKEALKDEDFTGDVDLDELVKLDRAFEDIAYVIDNLIKRNSNKL